ncbi:hypothetical protein [Rhodococcoides fascians]|uniref:hypothetical protein n=1 Tax=Rhodococcoides fascians TaxID=1828 RepID=UPI00050BE8E3|nr:hypothetical protein [Rhodococcus fascians]
MDEKFRAFPEEISGLGRLVSEISSQTMKSYKYFNENAVPDAAEAGALLGTLVAPLEGMKDIWLGRHVHLAVNCGELGNNLNTAAWLYSDQDQRNYEALNRHTHGLPVGMPGYDPGDANRAATGSVDDYSDVVDYGRPEGIDYPAPATFPDDLAAVIADAAGWLGDIDNAIEHLIGHSPLQELVRPVGGNWNDLRRLGGAYRIAGEAMEHGGEALAGGTSRVDPKWNGLAAVAYKGYAAKQVEARKWEGACGRVVEAVAERASEEIRESAHALVRTVREMVEKELDLTTGEKVAEFLVKKAGIAGITYQLYRVYDILRTGYELAMTLYESIRTGIAALKEFLTIVASPSGYLNEQFEQKLAPVTKWLNRTDLAKDILTTADAGPMYHVPQDPYSLGTDKQPWADA